MPKAYFPFGTARVNAADTVWRLHFDALLPDDEDAPDVATLPAGRELEFGQGDTQPAASGVKATPPFAASFVRVALKDRGGAVLSRLLAAKEAGEPLRSLRLRLVEDLDDAGDEGGPFPPAPGYDGPREWTGFVQLDTLKVPPVSRGTGRVFSFYAYCGIDKAEDIGVPIPVHPGTGTINFASVHAPFALTLWAQSDEGPGLHARPILYALPMTPQAANGLVNPDADAAPYGWAWPEHLSVAYQDSADGADPRRGGVLHRQPDEGEPPNVALAAEALAAAMFARVWQGFNGWNVAALPAAGEGTDGADDWAGYFFRFEGPRADAGGVMGRHGELAQAGAVAGRRIELAVSDYDRAANVFFLSPITRLVATVKRGEAFGEETPDNENAWAWAQNPGANYVFDGTGTFTPGVGGWEPTGSVLQPPGPDVYGFYKPVFNGVGSLSQTLGNVAGGGAPAQEEDGGTLAGGDVKTRAQYAAARLKLGLGLVGAGTSGGGNATVTFRLTPDDGGPDLYANASGGWQTAATSINLGLPWAAAGDDFLESTVQVVVATPIPKAGVMRFTLANSNAGGQIRVLRVSPHVGDVDGNPLQEWRSDWGVWESPGAGTGEGVRRAGKTASMEHNFRRLGAALRTNDYLFADTPTLDAWTGSTFDVFDNWPLTANLRAFAYVTPGGGTAEGAGLGEVFAAWFLATFGRLQRQIEGAVRGRVLEVGDVVLAPVETPDGEGFETVEFVVTGVRADLKRNVTKKFVGVERPRFRAE